MKKFNIDNLNNIKDICNDSIGTELPHKKPVSKSKVTVAIIAFLICLMPMTAYAAKYTLSYLEYSTTEANVKQESLDFVSDFIKYAYGKNNNYLVNETYEESFGEFLKHSALCLKNDTYNRIYHDVGYSWNMNFDNKILNVKNIGSAWYVEVDSSIEETRYKDDSVFNKFSIKFFLKYEGYMSDFKLVDMYFASSKSYGETVFGDIGTLENALNIDEFVKFADELSDYRYYLNMAKTVTKDVYAYENAEKAAEKFADDYLWYYYGDKTPFEGKTGPVYELLESIKNYIDLGFTNGSQLVYRGENNINVSHLEYINGAWYASVSIVGTLYYEDSGETYGLDRVGGFHLKFKEFEGIYDFEDIYLKGPQTYSHLCFHVGEKIKNIWGLEKFIEWADKTDNYDELIANVERYTAQRSAEAKVEERIESITNSFIMAAYGSSENPWVNKKEGSVEEFLGASVEYFKTTAVEDYEIEVYSIFRDSDGYGYSIIEIITLDEDGSVKTKEKMKFFFKFKLVLGEYVLEDIYYYGFPYQCKNIFEKASRNNYSLIEDSFKEWAERTEEYSYYTQRAKDAAESFKNGILIMEDAPVDPYK